MSAVDEECPKDAVQRVLKYTASEDTHLVGLSQLLGAVRRGDTDEVLQCYLEKSKECNEILRYLQWDRQRQSSDGILLCFRLLKTILLYTASTGGQLLSAGTALVQRLLQQCMRVVYAGLAGGPSNSTELVSTTVKLLTAMVAQDVSCARDVLEVFDFSYKPLERLSLQQKGSKHKDSPRQCFINFAISFLVVGDTDVIHGILNIKGFLSSVLKHLQKDPEEVAVTVLTVVKEKVVLNPTISKKAKSLFFTRAVLVSLAQFLIQEEEDLQLVAEGDGPGGVHLPVLCFQLLIQLCTNFQTGVCYRSKWGQVTQRRSNNPVLLSFIQSLTLHLERPLVQRLIISTITACPDLLLPYMKTLPFSLEPRLSTKWVSSVDFIIKLYSSLPPVGQLYGAITTATASDGSHDKEDSTLDHSNTVLGFCLPPPFTRNSLNVGIQNPSSLVKHLSLAVMALSLQRVAALLSATASKSSSKDARKEAFRDTVLRNLPDIKTVIALHHNLIKAGSERAPTVSGASETPPELQLRCEGLSRGKTLLLQVLDVMAGYLRISPLVFVYAGFDVGKLLTSSTALSASTEEVDVALWKKILVLLSSAPKGTLKWYHQGSNMLQTVLELVFHKDPTISQAAAVLLYRVLQECPLLEDLPAEVMLFVDVVQQHARHKLIDSNGTSKVADFLASAFLELTHNSTFQSNISENLGVDLGTPNVVRASRVVGVTPCVLMMRMLSVMEVCDLFLLGELLQRCLHQANNTIAMATTFLSLLESQEWLQLVKDSHDQSVLHYQQLLVAYLSAWGRGIPRVRGRPGEGEESCQGSSVKKRLKKLWKTQLHTADIPVTLILVEILATSPSALADELPCAYKWIVKHLPETTVAAIDHFLTFFPSYLSSLASVHEDTAVVPVSLILKSKLLGWSTFPENDRGLPQSKRKRRDQRIATGISPYPFSPSGLLEGMLCDDAFQVEVIAATKHTVSQTDIMHSVHILQSLLILALSKQEEGAAEGTSGVQPAVTVLVDLLKTLLSKLNDLINRDRAEPKGSETPSLEEGLSAFLDSVFSHSLLSSPLQFASVESAEDTRFVASGKKRRQKDRAMNSRHIGLQMAELIAFCAHLCPPWKASATFQTILRQSVAGLEEQYYTGSCSIMKVLFPLMEVEEKLSVIDTLIDLCINQAGTGEKQPIVDLLLTILPKTDHTQDDGSYGSEDEMTAGEPVNTGGGQTLFQCISPSSLEKVIKAVTSDAAKPETGCQLEAIAEAVLSALLSPSLVCQKHSETAIGTAVRKTARSILEVLDHFDRVSPAVLPPLLSRQSLSSMASGCGHPAHLVLSCVSESVLQVYFQHCLKQPSPSRVRTCALLFHHVPALQTWLSSDEGITFLRDALSPAAQDSALVCLLPFIKAYFEVVSTGTAVRSTNIFTRLEEVLWESCCELLLQAGADKQERAGDVLILLVKGMQKKRLKKKQKNLMKTLLAAREEGKTIWSRIHLHVLEVLIPYAAVNKPTLLFAATAQIIDDLHTQLVKSSKSSTSSTEAAYCSLGSLALSHCHLCCKIRGTAVQLEPFGGQAKLAHMYNSIVRCILKSHFLSHVHLDFLCHLITFVNCAKNSIAGSDVIPGSMIQQMIWNHSRFLDVILANLEPNPLPATLLAKDAIVQLLVALLPATDPTPAQCTILLAAYQATLSNTDRGILYLLSQFEVSGVKLANSSRIVWGKPALDHYQSTQKLVWLLWKQPSMQEVLSCLRRDQLFHSVTGFPLNKPLEPTNPYDSNHGNYQDSNIYDPSFLLPFFAHHLHPGAVVDCRRFVESGCWSYLLSALASSCVEVRAASYHCLIQFRGHLEGARFREKAQVVMVMSILQNSITEENQQLSSVHAQLFSKLSQLFLKPDNELYSILGNFVVYRPVVDLSTVPLANLLFYSSSPVAKSERSWMLKILVDGLRTEEDYLLYKRQGVFTSAMAFWESAVNDPQAKGLILQLLDMAVQLRVALVDLVKRRGLFSWIHRGLQATGAHHQHGRWQSLLHLACSTWEQWSHLTTEAAEGGGYLPYPHIAYQAALLLQDVQQHTSP